VREAPKRDGPSRHAPQGAGPKGERPESPAYETLPLPRSLRELVGRRLQALPGPARALAQAAAVAGRESPVALLQRMLPLAGPQLLEAAAELLRRQVLEDSRPGCLRFVHDKLREVAYEALDAAERPRLHRAAAEAIEALQVGERHLAELGRHWQQAGDLPRARQCLLAAARDAASHDAHADAERLYRAYLALVRTPTAESIEARNELGGKVLSLQGRAAERILEHRRALEEARGLGLLDAEAQSLLNLGLTSFHARRMDETRELLEQAIRTAREAGARCVEAQALAHLAGMHVEQGRVEEARSACQQALALNREMGDRPSEGLALFNLARICVMQSSPEAVAFYRQALAIHRELGDRRMQVFDLTGLAIIDSIHGRFAECQAFYEQALVLVREVGDRRMEGIVLVYLADNAVALGRLEAARTYCVQALPVHRAAGDRMGEVMNRQILAAVERRLGAFDAAESLLEQCESIAQEIGQAYLNLVQLREHGHLALARDRSARSLLDRARELAVALKVAPGDQLGRPIEQLEHAVEAFERGEVDRLFRGECVEDLPEPLRRRLETGGQR
jgi:tetratricopeptide (TPR) repeat protein